MSTFTYLSLLLGLGCGTDTEDPELRDILFRLLGFFTLDHSTSTEESEEGNTGPCGLLSSYT